MPAVCSVNAADYERYWPNSSEIWVFYEGHGQWGLKVHGKWEKAKHVSICIPMVGVMRPGASPNCYLKGFGRVVREGESVTLVD